MQRLCSCVYRCTCVHMLARGQPWLLFLRCCLSTLCIETGSVAHQVGQAGWRAPGVCLFYLPRSGITSMCQSVQSSSIFFSVCVGGGGVLGLARHALYRLSYLPSLFIYYLFETGLHCNTGQPQTLCVTMDVLEAPWGSRSYHHTLLQECFKSLTGILHKA